ncbi:hypothetical protein EYE40_15200 [Glaciihabitans arcticus]|uniref:Uncharacterized protein n=1 Tax=Glaciihabitans arcticus TaxID=2668039 RepID=A0A4Q9GMF8_9MICO|nr:hypothetical protein [Glaciihabitans arcticus]TBN55543.1 hypothetical protein EYE40_15200 [Glaciihabitans arcticus]
MSAGGDMRYSLSRASSQWQLFSQERAEAEVFEAGIPNQIDVRRLLLLHFGLSIRTQRGMPPVWIESDSVAPGFTIDADGDRERLMRGSVLVAEFPRDRSSRATRFSWIADADPDELLASYQHTGGKPLLSKWVQPPAPQLTCSECRAYFHAERKAEVPPKLLEIPGAFLHRCRICGTYWIDSQGKVAKAVTPEEALRVFPELGAGPQ